jgi:hypothetical protein
MVEWLPEWLFEGQLTVYAVLGAAFVFLFALWKKHRRRAYLVAWCVPVALVVVYLALDILVETDREQITRVFQEIAAEKTLRDLSLKAQDGYAPIVPVDYDRIFSHVSDSYNRHGMNKDELQQVARATSSFQNITVSDFEFPPGYKEKESPADERENIARVRFLLKLSVANGMWENVSAIEAVMHRDADGRWRVQTWEAFDPKRTPETVVRVPNLP